MRLNSFRNFVLAACNGKLTVDEIITKIRKGSDLGYHDFSEYFIDHSGSTYWTKKESEKAETFQKIESYLTFLNVHQLERKGADIQSKVDELEQLNQSLLERDRTKDDAIALLSDQLMILTGRLQEMERRQHYKCLHFQMLTYFGERDAEYLGGAQYRIQTRQQCRVIDSVTKR